MKRSGDSRPAPFVVVLTGGIASGKTVVSDRFSGLGVPVIDMDCIAHEIVEPGQPALEQIRDTFGADFLDGSGRLDRRKLREVIFAEPKLRKRLESILHPLIGREALRRVNEVDYPYCLVVIPLYSPSEKWSWVDRVLVVDVDEETQIERVMARDRIDRAQAAAILKAQSGRKDRLAHADDVIDNSGELESTLSQADALHRKYLEMTE